MRQLLPPQIGLLLIATTRFKKLGEELPEGGYEARKVAEAMRYKQSLEQFGEVVCPSVVYTREDLEAAMTQFTVQHVDCVFALFLSWSEDFVWVRFLRDMPPVPIFFACVNRDSISFDNTNEETDFVEFLSAGGLVGALEASGSVQRFKRPMLVTAIGSYDEIMAKADAFCHASAVRTLLRNSSFGLLSSYNEVMWSTYVDPYDLFQKAGPELRFLSVLSLLEQMDKITPDTVSQTCTLLSERYPTLPDVESEKFAASVRASLGVEALARSANVSMVVLNDVDTVLLTHVGLRPGFLPCPGTEDITVVPEGDLGAGLAVYILKQLSGKSVSFVEPFYIDAQAGCFAAGHAGPNDYTDTAGSVKIARDVRFAKTNYKHAGAPFAWYVIPPGRKTLLHISQCDGRFKMICTLVDALPCEHFITSYSHGLLRPVNGDCNELFDKLLHLGVTQHYGLVDGDYTLQLTYLAELLDFDFTLI